MIITKEQAQLLADLAAQIQEKYGLIIGYSNPQLPTPMYDADFIIYDNPELEDLRCFHKDDVKTQPHGTYLIKILPQEPEHDYQVEGLLTRINNDLLEGKIWFDPGLSKVVDGMEISVTKRRFPGYKEDIFQTNIYTERYGMMYTYDFIKEAARIDKRFLIAKEIIDEHWPREELEEAEELKSELEPELEDFHDLLKKFLKYFGY